MIARGIHDYSVLTTAGAAGGKYSGTIKQQKRRLEGLILQLTFAGGTATTPTSESYAKLLKRVRVKVNDVAGSRFVVDVEGVAILDEWLMLGGQLPWQTLYAMGNTAGGSVGTVVLTYPVFFRHPQLQEPGGNLTSIPLYDLREDLSVDVELGANTDIAASGVTISSTTIRLAPLYRETIGGEYIPGEWISSDRDSLPASSRVEVELPSNGLLTSVLVQNYTAAAKLVRGTLITAGENDVSLYYGRDQIRKFHPDIGHAASFLTSQQIPAMTYAALGVSALSHSFLIDLLDDLPMTDAFSAGSALNLTSIRAGGDTARLAISLTSATAPCVRLTTRKWLGGPIDKLILA